MARQNKNRNFGYFLAELVILVVGITASFMLNEYRISRAEARKEVELLQSFHDNLTSDSTLLSAYLDIYDKQIDFANSILSLDQNAAYTDSTARNVLGLLTYSPFTPSEITYQEMLSLGESHIIQNDSLLTSLISLYEVDYDVVQEWAEVDGQHIKERLIPFLMEHFPYTNGLNFPAMSSAKKRELMKQVNSDQFRYLIQFGAAYKTSTKAFYEGTLVKVRFLIGLINSALPE